MKNSMNSKSKIALFLSASLASSALMLQPAMAAMPNTHIFNNAVELSDEVLAGMRGRFVSSGTILYFGVDMVTQWLTADGSLQSSAINLSVDKEYRPTITFVTQTTPSSSGATAATATGAGNVTISGGLDNVSGIAQSIQIGGDSNTIRNGITMDITLNASESNSKAGVPAGTPLTSAGTTVIPGEGSSTTFTLSDNNLAVMVDVEGQGQVLQQLKGSGSAGFLQSAQIGGDMNMILNTIAINAGLTGGSGGGGSTPGIQGSLRSLQGISTAGIF